MNGPELPAAPSTPERLGRWMRVRRREPAPGRRMPWFEVIGSDGAALGGLSYYTPWRQYAFVPADEEIALGAGCLADLAAFMRGLPRTVAADALHAAQPKEANDAQRG